VRATHQKRAPKKLARSSDPGPQPSSSSKDDDPMMKEVLPIIVPRIRELVPVSFSCAGGHSVSMPAQEPTLADPLSDDHFDTFAELLVEHSPFDIDGSLGARRKESR